MGQAALDQLIEEAKCTVVLIAHRLSTVIGATQIAVIHKGQIVELGNHSRLVDQGGVYAALVSRQLQRQSEVIDQSADSKAKADNVDALVDAMEEQGLLEKESPKEPPKDS